MSIRFSEEDVRDHGPPHRRRPRHHLGEADAVVALAVVVSDATLLVAGENGIGKRTVSTNTASNPAAAKASLR